MRWRELLPRWHPMHRDPVLPAVPKFAFCETVTAGGSSRWHIRELTTRGKMLSGGADTPALCGREVSWDLRMDVNERQLEIACIVCARNYINRSKA